VKWLALALLVACHHGVDGDAATTWLEARGSAAATWEPCLRIGTAMHAACGGDAACGLEATRTFSYWCYAGRYAGKSASDDPLSLSPCFWNRVGDHASNVAFEPWAAQICDRFKLPAKPCKDELHDVVQSCNEDLTGAGP
jgi:hypothetical protein